MKNADEVMTIMNRKTRSISKNLTLSLVLVIVLLTMAFISIYYYQVSKREQLRLENTADELIHSIASTLEVPLWDLDRENITTVCDFYMQNNSVLMLKLIGVSGEVMYHSETETTVDENKAISRSRGIFHDQEQIGTVEFRLSPVRSQETRLELLRAAIAAMVIAVVGLVLCTGFLLKKFLKQPLDLLGRIAKSYSSGDYHPRLSMVSYQEFEPLVSVLVDMGGLIESQLQELQKAEESLKKHRDHLEELVVRRTRELETSNKELQAEIQERSRAQERLRANEQRLEAILRASPVGIGLVMNRQLDWANETMYQMLGYEKDALQGQDASVLYADQQEYERVGEELYTSISNSKPGNVETKWVRRDGTVFDCLLRAYSLDAADPVKGQIVAVTDVSEAKLMEARLNRAEKMEAIGTLAGGVAHDLNNILSGVVSYPELLLLDIPEESPLRSPLETIQKSGQRAVEIVQDLLTMARRGVSITEVVNVNHIIAGQLQSPEMQRLQSFHPDVEVRTELADDLLNVKGSSTHLLKCVMNLVSNAAEAMSGGGTIEISTWNDYLDAPLRGYEQIVEGDYVTVSVSDTGMGMSEEDTQRIFEPFYTKKTIVPKFSWIKPIGCLIGKQSNGLFGQIPWCFMTLNMDAMR